MTTVSSFDRDEAFQLLRQLVAVRSYPGEERAVQEVVAGWLTAAGLAPEFQATANGQPNIIAQISNGPGPTLLLNGHVDTVLAVEGWPCDPWQGRLEGDRFSALGAGDMKAGVVVNMLVARTLARQRDAWQGTLIFSSVTDEEAYSFGARALVASGLRADACIVTEPSFDALIIGAPGKILVRATAVGKAAHGFRPHEGVNAAIELARFIAHFAAAVPTLHHPHLPTSQTVLSFLSGSAQYVITLPERAEALITRQIIPGESEASLLDALHAFAETLHSPARFTFTIEPPYYPPFELGQDQPLLRAMRDASAAILGTALPVGYSSGVSDANIFAGEAGIPTVFFGPRAGDWHQSTEWVDLSTIVPCAQIVLETALRLLRNGE